MVAYSDSACHKQIFSTSGGIAEPDCQALPGATEVAITQANSYTFTSSGFALNGWNGFLCDSAKPSFTNDGGSSGCHASPFYVWEIEAA